MADTNFSRSGGTGATGWLIGGAILVFLLLIMALGFSGTGTTPVTDPAAPAIETAPTQPAAPAPSD